MVVFFMILGILLVLGLSVIATLAFYLGLLGAIGAVRIVRCDRCNHWGWTSAPQPLRTCPICRHGSLLHPIAASHLLHHRSHHHAERGQ